MPINFLQGSNFPDDAKLTFGDSSDLKIWHDSGTGTSYISDQGTGNLHIQADSKIRLESYAATEKFAIFELNGAADIYYDNNLKLSTTNTGISITGGFVTTSSSDCAGLNMTSDIAMGANNITTTGYIGRDGDNFITFNTDDSILLRVAGSYRGRWDSTGLNPYADSTSDLGQTAKRWANLWVDSINGSTPAVGADYLPLAGGTMTGNIICPDGSVSAPSIGNTGDTNTGMYWPGDHQLGFAVNGSRKFYISETKAYFQNLSSGIEIGAGGIDVTGNSSIQGSLSITGDGSNAATLTESGSGDFTIASVDDLRLDSGGNDIVLRGASSSEFGRLSNSSQNFVIKNITADKDIIFQSDDGTGGGTATYFYLDGSGVRTIFEKLTRHNDDVYAAFGSDSDLRIYHDGSNSYIKQVTGGTGNIIIEQDVANADIIFKSDDGSGGTATYFFLDGGTSETDDLITNFPDNSVLTFGDGRDLKIYHDGTHSRIKDAGAGNLTINATDFVVNNSADTANFITATDGGAVTLYCNAAVKAATTSAGFSVTGKQTISTIDQIGSDTDKFLMSDSGEIKYVTGANLRSYIGAGTGSGTVTGTGVNNRLAIWSGTSSIDSDSDFYVDGDTIFTTNLEASGTVTWSGGGSSESNSAYDNMITAFSDSGSSTITLTLTQQDGGTLTTSFSNPQGTVTSVTAGTGLDGGTITGSGTIDLADTAVSAGSYTNASITVDAQGRLTSASTGSDAQGVTSVATTSPILGGTITGTGTISHATQSDTETTSSETLTSADTFTAYTSVTTNATGHVTGHNLKTYTLPTSVSSSGVTSVTFTSDSGSTSAVTSTGTIDIAGGTNVSTSATGSTVTINATDTNTQNTYVLDKAAGSTDLKLYKNGAAVAQDTITFSGTANEVEVTGTSEDAYVFGLPSTVAVTNSLSCGDTLTSGGALTINTISQIGSDTNKFLMSDSGVVKYVTGANLRSYIGAGTGSGDGTVTSVTFTESTGNKAGITLGGSTSWTTSGTLDIGLDIQGQTALGATPAGGDYLLLYDASGLSNKKVSVTNLVAAAPQGDVTASSTTTFTNKSGNISQWTNDSGYTTNSGTVTGTGVNQRIAYWTGTSSLSSDNGLTYNSTDNKLIFNGDYAIREDGSGTFELNCDGSDILTKINGFGSNGSMTFDENSIYTTASGFYVPTGYGISVGTTSTTSNTIRCTGNIIAYYSDERLKNFQGTIPNALDKVCQLNGYYYKQNKKASDLGFDNEERQVGISAQEVEKVLPEVIETAPISHDIEEDYLTVDYGRLVPLLIESIKELKNEIEILKNKKCGN